MAKIPINLKGFRHVSSSDDTTTLSHPAGHIITLSHKALHPDNQAQLKALAGISKAAETPLEKDEIKHNAVAKAEGGRVMYADSDTLIGKENPYSTAHKIQHVFDPAKPTDSDPINRTYAPTPVYNVPSSSGARDTSAPSREPASVPESEEPAIEKEKYAPTPLAKGGGVDGKENPQGTASEPTSRPDKGFGAVVVRLAKGGQAQANPKLEESKKTPRYCMYCGGMAHGGECKSNDRKMYADPQEMIAQDDNAPTIPQSLDPNSEGQIVPDFTNPNAQPTIETPPQLSPVQQEYNRELGSRREANAKFGTGPISTQQFGEHGEEPSQINPKIAEQASNVVSNQATDAKHEQDAMQADQQKQDKARGMLGLAPKEQQAEAPASITDQADEPMHQAPTDTTPPPTFSEHKEQTRQDLHQEDQAFKNDLEAGHIQPKTYHDLMGKKDTLGKISTLFGMLVSGLGSGMSGQKNAVLERMNQEISNDLDAQKSSAANKMTLMKINQEGLMNKAKINEMNQDTAVKRDMLTRMQTNRIAFHEMVQQANSYPEGSPQKANAMQALAMIHPMIDAQNANFADRASAASAYYNTVYGTGQQANANPEDSFKKRMMAIRASGNDPLAKELEAKHVPGIGDASVPVPQDIRDKLINSQKLEGGIKDLQHFINNNTTIVPGTPSYNVGAQKAKVLQSMVREGFLGTVYREGEQPLLDAFVNSNPAGAMKLMKTQPQLNELLSSSTRNTNILKQQYGLPQSAAMRTNEAPQIKGADGRMYQQQTINGKSYYLPVK